MKPTYEPMLLEDGKLRGFPSSGWVIEPKRDGWRFLFEVDRRGVHSFAGRNASDRTGQPVVPEAVLAGVPVGTIIDAELYVPGQPASSVSTVLAHPDAGELCVAAFDVLQVGGISAIDEPLEERRKLLVELGKHFFDGHTVFVTEQEPAKLAVHEAHVNVFGYEGSVIKRLGSKYRPGRRSPDWQKHKPQQTTDAVIVGFEQGKGSRAGQLGAFVIELMPSGYQTSCSIPTDEMRAEITKHPERALGRVMELRHHGQMESGAVRHPVFARWRPDLDQSTRVDS